jgi:predicted RNA methylase
VKGRCRHQILPAAGPERERLRQKGQFWTPAWVARAMIEYVMAAGDLDIFDPAVGAGAFFRAARAVAAEHGVCVLLSGSELDRAVLAQAREAGVSAGDLDGVEIRDFVFSF